MIKHDLPVVFLAFARHDISPYVDLPRLLEEADKLRSILDALAKTGFCELITLQNATLEQILAVFRDARYSDRIVLFHFGGHGGDYSLLVEDSRRKQFLAHGAGLAEFLAEHGSLQLVFFNSCLSSEHVAGLHGVGIPAIVATTEKVQDDWALIYAVGFYQGLAGGEPIQSAHRMALAEVKVHYPNAAPDAWRVFPKSDEALVWRLIDPAVAATGLQAGRNQLEGAARQILAALMSMTEPAVARAALQASTDLSPETYTAAENYLLRSGLIQGTPGPQHLRVLTTKGVRLLSGG